MGLRSAASQLKRDLGLIDIFAIASGAMISSGLFVLPGLAYAKAGPAVIFSYAIASLLIIPSVLSKAELSTAMPKAGGSYFFIDRSMGPLMGTIGGFAAWFSLAFKSAFALIGIGLFAVLFSPGLTELQIKLVAVLFCIIFASINIRGVSHTGKTQIALVAMLLALLVIYIVTGIFFIQPDHFTNLVPFGTASIFSTAGLIFVSFGGLTKICSVAEECKEPGRNIPLGMFLSWGIISLLYLLVIGVTIGLVEPAQLLGPEGAGSTTPISLGAGVVMGPFGFYIMAIAAILAFVSTANAGLLAASRDPMAMGKDQLLPHLFSKVSKRGTPIVSILFTTAFMIFVILFLDLEGLVKTASTLKILLFIFVLLSIIIMRESNIRHYRPKFKSPFYPWAQIAGLIGLILLLTQMGIFPMVLVGCFIAGSFGWYMLYARDRIWREYTLLHLVERITGQKKTGYLVDEELREILISRDEVTEKRFLLLLGSCEIVDLLKYMLPDKFMQLLAERLASRLNMKVERLYGLLKNRKKDSNFMMHPGVAIFSHIIRGKNKFEIVIVRSRKGLIISDDHDPIHAFFLIISSKDQESFYLHSLMWIAEMTGAPSFDMDWIAAADKNELRELLINSWVDREI
jgi:APA family basic amino acid/polyamine antiporter